MAKSFTKKIGIGPVRLSYCKFAERDKNSGKFTCVLMLPKTDKESYSTLKKACAEVYENNESMLGDYEFSTLFPVHDGNGAAPQGKHYPPEYKGFWIINASNKMNVSLRVKNEDGVYEDSEDPMQDFYSGCWAKAGLCLFPYSNQRTGIGVSLDVLRKTKDDEHFGAVVREDDYFSDDDDDEEDI